MRCRTACWSADMGPCNNHCTSICLCDVFLCACTNEGARRHECVLFERFPWAVSAVWSTHTPSMHYWKPPSLLSRDPYRHVRVITQRSWFFINPIKKTWIPICFMSNATNSRMTYDTHSRSTVRKAACFSGCHDPQSLAKGKLHHTDWDAEKTQTDNVVDRCCNNGWQHIYIII